MTIVNRDLLAAHQVLKLMERSKSQADEMLDSMPGLHLIFDERGRVLRANRSLAQATGIDHEKLFGYPIANLFLPGTWDAFEREAEKLTERRNETVEFELPLDGLGAADQIFLWRLSRVELPNRFGARLLYAMGTDISKLRVLERRLTDLFRTLPVGLLTVNAKGVVEEVYSASVEYLLGRSDIVGLDFIDAVFGPGRADLEVETLRGLDALAESYGKRELHFDLLSEQFPTQIKISPDGDERWIGIKYQPVVTGDVVGKVLILLEDRTVIVRAELERQAQREHDERGIQQILQVKRISKLVLPVIARELELCVSRLQRAVDSEDGPALLRVLHTIKGNARVAGFPGLGSPAHELETALKDRTESGANGLDWAAVRVDCAPIFQEWAELQTLITTLHPGAVKDASPSAGVAGRLLEEHNRLMAEEKSASRDLALAKLALAINALNHQPLAALVSVMDEACSTAATTLEKKVSLRVSGADILIDPELRSRLSEILLHLISNAVAHGIESPATRVAAGKPETGLIQVSFSHHAGQLRLRVIDDGAGIDVDRLRQIGVVKRLITLEQSIRMSREDLMKLILLPGFSTRAKTDEIAGRGIGMDVIAVAARELGGGIEISSELGKGSMMEVWLPAARVQLRRSLNPLPEVLRQIQEAMLVSTRLSGEFLSAEILERSRGLIYADAEKLRLALATLANAFWRGAPPESSSAVRVDFGETGTCRISLSRDAGSPAQPLPANAAEILPFCIEILESHCGTLKETERGYEIEFGPVLFVRNQPPLTVILPNPPRDPREALLGERMLQILDTCGIAYRVADTAPKDPSAATDVLALSTGRELVDLHDWVLKFLEGRYGFGEPSR